MAIRGSCLCGGVTFEIDRACGPAEYCHCNRCRKVSGSSSLLSIRVNTQDYRFLTGHELVKTYSAPILYSPPTSESIPHAGVTFTQFNCTRRATGLASVPPNLDRWTE